MIRVVGGENWDPQITLEVIDDPAVAERNREQREQFERNCDWITTHWNEVLPQAYGKFLAVACQEAFIADTPQEARALARAKHPQEKGLFLEYVMPPGGPRIYMMRA